MNCGFLSNGLGTNVRPDLGYFNGVEIQFAVKGNLNGYTVKVSRTRTTETYYNGQLMHQESNAADGPKTANTAISGSIYSIDAPGFFKQDVNSVSGMLSLQIIGNFVETAIIQDANGNIVSQHSVQWNSSMQIGRSSPDGNFQYIGGSIGPGHVTIP